MNFVALVVSNAIRESRLERLRTLDDRSLAADAADAAGADADAADAADAADVADAADAEAADPPRRLSRQESLSLLEDTDEAKEAERQMYQNHTALLLSFGVYSMFSAVWSVDNVKDPVPGRD